VKDQQTVVIGGLVRNRVARTDTKIPLLGDIPVLGALFRSRSSSLQKSNLILVLTPYIIREQADLRLVFERKMQERQEFLDHYFVFAEQNEYEPPKDYSRTNGLLEDIRQSYMDVDEQRRLEALTGPREVKTHEPSQPLELPAPINGAGAGGGGPAEMPRGAPPPTPPPGATPGAGSDNNAPPPVNVAPQPRSVDRVEGR
jgi:general secretion pathway protein D